MNTHKCVDVFKCILVEQTALNGGKASFNGQLNRLKILNTVAHYPKPLLVFMDTINFLNGLAACSLDFCYAVFILIIVSSS